MIDKKLWKQARDSILSKGVVVKEYYSSVKNEYEKLKGILVKEMLTTVTNKNIECTLVDNNTEDENGTVYIMFEFKNKEDNDQVMAYKKGDSRETLIRRFKALVKDLENNY